ncbi:type III pantothenate kinase [Bacteroides sp. 224]|uniref:type III pantothenate kinase n=1 Tax=Bacteroides sp. 224 TaxID=2302936 RepID=UPI0013D89224|nr:type III pantothenate kinase [Bacteroides sp. 224]NDV65573.1 type III pantothenate kinase [Bacteroides sp. 224]
MNLIIDVGNNRVKAAVFEGTALVEHVNEKGHELLFLDDLCGNFAISNAIIATTIDLLPHTVERLNQKLPFLLWLNDKTPLPIINLYETPQTLGPDRIAAAVGANDQYPGRNILVIDAGTAITYEFIDAEGRYQGGNISPGIQMRFKALNQYTGRLPLVNPEGRLLQIGKDTDTAIRAGVLKGVEYEIQGYITYLNHKYPDLLVFLTGGDQFSFDTNVKNIIFADSFLVLKGLNRILNFNNGKL